MLMVMAEAVAFESLVLTAVCKCGAVFNASVEMPTYCELSDYKGTVHRLRVAEHIIVKCPRCNRLLNVGNGSKRKTKPDAKHEKAVYVLS
jgi:phage FluMu protein Com